MNNQYILKFIISAKASKGYYVKKKKEEEEEQERRDNEITNLYNRGYFNPPEYNNYMARRLDYQYMINLFSGRMNNMYYYNYVEQKYLQGYMTNTEFEDYEFIFDGFYYVGDISYDFYIRALESALQIINSNY